MKSVHHVWHLDETYIRVKGKWCYLYCAIDSDGYTLDFQLRKTCNHQADYMFMKRLVNAFGESTILTTNKAPALLCALKNYKTMIFIHIQDTVPLNISITSLNRIIDMSNDVLSNLRDFKVSVMLHVQ